MLLKKKKSLKEKKGAGTASIVELSLVLFLCEGFAWGPDAEGPERGIDGAAAWWSRAAFFSPHYTVLRRRIPHGAGVRGNGSGRVRANAKRDLYCPGSDYTCVDS